MAIRDSLTGRLWTAREADGFARALEGMYRQRLDEGSSMNTILVHLNVTAPDGASAASVAAQIEGALEVGIDADNTPDLAAPGAKVDLVLAEEV